MVSLLPPLPFHYHCRALLIQDTNLQLKQHGYIHHYLTNNDILQSFFSKAVSHACVRHTTISCEVEEYVLRSKINRRAKRQFILRLWLPNYCTHTIQSTKKCKNRKEIIHLHIFPSLLGPSYLHTSITRDIVALLSPHYQVLQYSGCQISKALLT